jgi:hypothetical protein
MQKWLVILMIFSLTACAEPTAFYYKKSMVLATKQKDYDACKIKSFKQIPQNIITTYHPGVHNPGTLSCNTIGTYTSCNRVGALDIPASSSSRDANEGMRARFIEECMTGKGYSLVEVPMCSLSEQGYNPLQPAPSLDKIKCLDSDAPTLDN